MKINKSIFPAITLMTVLAISPIAFAKQANALVQLGADATVTASSSTTTSNASINADASAKARGEASTRQTNDANQEQKDEHSDAGDAHRSTVSAFVKGLHKISDRGDGIGAQVRLIAQAQNDSQKETADALVKVEKRNKIKTFFLGTDYKSIGTLRSKMVITANQIKQLQELADKTTNAADKAEISAQIKVLEQEQIKINAFIKAHSGKFSLFGWMFR